ncbi:type VI secretion system tube protein Hcp [Chitinimonas arctica]|uniref:Type VI secretion system tube protein Hcp n=1 Tax=Chitinimonas arctica TaxID=2594795 RepID=A0A516SBC1_9NEIS|nr:type VI secretion system tube protein Hcp [Chitinimonas arctica]QDQ25440.1 type VI secretion system tube protein Hcp [Chitinimonas arctica]
MAVDIHLKIQSIPGESQNEGHKEEMEILAWSWGLTQSGTMHSGTGGGAGKVGIQDISFTKYTDNASPLLVLCACKGEHLPEVILSVRKAAGTSPIDYYTITLKDVLVSSYSTGGSGGEDRFTENFSLNFASFHIQYKIQDAAGNAKAGTEAKWNIPANKSV